MFPKEFLAWYMDKEAQKGYKDLPVWLPQDLLVQHGPLPENPEDEGLSPSLALTTLQVEEPSTSPEPIPVPPPHQPMIILKRDAIDLTNSDDEGSPNPMEVLDEEDPLPLDHPGEEWEQYSLRLHGNTFLLTIYRSP
ncbi:hypothetical protein BJV74DRAFT_889435 [Russula compacta]|nr:hypothetical protein BJV74DRAFT_889435 [Russula compacta]